MYAWRELFFDCEGRDRATYDRDRQRLIIIANQQAEFWDLNLAINSIARSEQHVEHDSKYKVKELSIN